jgi:hypothetical protein
MQQLNARWFLTGFCAGAMLVVSVAVLIAAAEGRDESGTPPEQTRNVDPTYFVTGDSLNATLWRRNDDGSLTCVSRNVCRSSVPVRRSTRDE